MNFRQGRKSRAIDARKVGADQHGANLKRIRANDYRRQRWQTFSGELSVTGWARAREQFVNDGDDLVKGHSRIRGLSPERAHD